MKQTKLKYLMIGVLTIASISCMDKERDLSWERRHMPKEAYFDFNMTQAVALDINYCFKSENYRVLFDIYDQDPIEYSADGTVSQKGIEPIYRAVTDEKGKFSGEMNIPADLSEVWLSSDYLATVSPLKLTIDDSRQLSFNQDAYITALRSQTASKTRGVTVNQHTYLKEWHVLPDADWDNNGRPTNLEPKINIPPADVLYNIKYVFRKVTVKDESGKSKVMNISQNYPEFFDGSIKMTSDIPIVNPTEVSLVFITSSAAWYNTVGYYTYPTNNPPQSASDIKQIIAFPNTSPIYKTLGVRCRGTVNHHILTNHVVISDYGDRITSLIKEILRLSSDNSSVKYTVAISHACTAHQAGMRHDLAIIPDLHVLINVRKRMNRNVLPDLCA